MNLIPEEYDYYIAILKSGNFVRKKTLEELNQILHIQYRLFEKYTHTYHGPSNSTPWYAYTIIDHEGNPDVLRIGNFEITNIGEDNGYTNLFGRNIEIRDVLRNVSYSYKSKVHGIRFVSEELIPLLKELNDFGCSWEIRQFSLELEEMKKTYNELYEEHEDLKEKYQDLKEEYGDLKNSIRSILNDEK